MHPHLRLSSLLALLFLALLASQPFASLRAARHSSVEAQHVTVSLLVRQPKSIPDKISPRDSTSKWKTAARLLINAGDSGEPPSIKWTLPPASPRRDAVPSTQAPAPRPLMDFGYEDEVVFPIPIHVASDFHPAQPQATFAAHVTWLVCREVCIPGKADLALPLQALATAPPQPKTDAAAQILIARFQNQLPKPLPRRHRDLRLNQKTFIST